MVWFESPAAGARAAALLTGRRELPGRAAPSRTAAIQATVAPGPTGVRTATLQAVVVEPAAGSRSTDGVEIADSLRTQGCPPSAGSAGISVRSAVRTAAWAAARDQVRGALGPDGWARLWSACGADVSRMVNDRVASPLREHLRVALPENARSVLLDAVGGQHDAGWLAVFDAVQPTSGGSPGSPLPAALNAAQRLAGLAGVARSAGWWWPYGNVAILTERPVDLRRDNIGRLHAADGPALRYRDGFGLHAWRGMPVPSNLVERLSRLTLGQISTEPDAGLRRVMLEHYGYDRYLREAGARRVAEDECGVLWHLAFRDDEPLVMVEVVNSTPEPDGTRRTYWLRVPPQTRSAREGVAWTFGLTEQQYRPLAQT